MSDLANLLDQPVGGASLWLLDRNLTFLNHGSFGSCPKPVLEFQQEIRLRLERQPIRFFVSELEALLDEARAKLASFLRASPDDLVFVPNATAGVNTVLRSLRFDAGDELLVTNHEYNACRNALNYIAERSGTRVVVVSIPFPLEGADAIIDAVLQAASSRTRLALLDHVTSQTGMIFPVERLARELDQKGIDLLVDGAHAPGTVPLDLNGLRAAYYTGNCHKWLCAPKGAGFLHVRADRQSQIRPLAISHGANSSRRDRSRFQIEFSWTGTWDPSAFLTVPEAIRFMDSLMPGGWTALMQRNRALVLAGRKILCQSLQLPVPCPEDFIGALASIPLPDASSQDKPTSPLYGDPLQDKLRKQFNIEVPVIPWPAWPHRLLRISAQLYNSRREYEKLAQVLPRLLG